MHAYSLKAYYTFHAFLEYLACRDLRSCYEKAAKTKVVAPTSSRYAKHDRVETEICLDNSFGEHGIKLRLLAASRSHIVKAGVSGNSELGTLRGSSVALPDAVSFQSQLPSVKFTDRSSQQRLL